MNELIAHVLNDPKPTKSAVDERHLAVALGYPSTWHVVRRVDEEGKIWDVIYGGNPRHGNEKKNQLVDCWYHHEAAMKASLSSSFHTNGTYNPFQFKGGHLVRRTAKFAKNDFVQVKYRKKWYDAYITKMKEHDEGFRYSVRYTDNDSTQDNIRESKIQLPTLSEAVAANQQELAASMGLPAGWMAQRNGGGKRYQITSPDGLTFRTKKAALEYFVSSGDSLQQQQEVDEGDPPWRTSGHEYIGRTIRYQHEQRLSGIRTVTLNQVGTITGWISELDKDRAGNPGYTNEKTGEPAALFHVEFDETKQPGLHQYQKYLVESMDMELYEIEACLEPKEGDGGQEDEPQKKKAKTE